VETIATNQSWTAELDRRARELSWLVLDVDGVLTDGRLHVSADGELFKSFHVRDGLAIRLAQAGGLTVGILSARASEIVARRAAEVGIAEVIQGSGDKGEAFRELLARKALAPASVAYMGDDLQDLPALRAAGFSAAPADAAAEVRAAVDFVTAAPGGNGAVREVVERLLVARGSWPAIVARLAAGGASNAGAG
jgi:3-deoxy-D-manno-octulosonate 8-phosphate phosphatase (KDO 8-P phosphatase)